MDILDLLGIIILSAVVKKKQKNINRSWFYAKNKSEIYA